MRPDHLVQQLTVCVLALLLATGARHGEPLVNRKSSALLVSATEKGLKQKETAAKDNITQFKEFLEDRTEVGTRLTTYRLVKEKDESFLGSVDYLDAQQSYLPNKFFVNWLISPEWAVELTWDRIEARTVTTDDGHTDGDIIARGPIATVVYRHRIEVGSSPDKTGLTPSAGIGLAYMNTEFDHDEAWHHGFSRDIPAGSGMTYEKWVAAGRPDWPNNGYQRNMSFDNAWAFVLTGGISMELDSNFALDLYIRYMRLEVEDTFTLSRYGDVFRTTRRDIPLSNYATGLGLRYSF